MIMGEFFDRGELHRCYDLLTMGVCLAKTDSQGTIVFANRELTAMYDCETEEEFFSFTGGRLEGLALEKEIPLPVDGDRTEMFRFSFLTAEKHMRSADGVVQTVKYGGKAYYLLQAENRQAEQRSRVEDELTGLPGSTKFYTQALDLARERTENGGFEQICPVCFNIANFREFSREYGVNTGDGCISYTASILKKVFPKGIFTRTEADNFFGLVPREDLEEKINQACAAVNRYLGQRSFSLKAGIVKFDEVAAPEVLRRSFDMARIACDSVKNDGEHSYAVFRKEMEEQLEKRRYILDHFDQALEEGYIKIYYQPVVRTLSGKVCSLEALARWEDPVKGMISPGVFVPVLESARRIGRLDQYIIEHAVQAARGIIASGRRAVPVSLNLSQLDFELFQPLECLNRVTGKYQVPHEYVYIEITETVVAENQERMAEIIRSFREAGYEVWLDDFGSGYSSLKSLNNFPFDLIKLDMGFFRDFDDQSRAIVTSVVMMAKRLGMHTLAEGVETKEQMDFLKKIGCERIQGYYYGRPAPGHAVRRLLNERNLQMESSLEESVYRKAGLENLVSEEPSCLFLCENGTLRILAFNDAYCRELESVGVSRLADEEGTVSSRRNPRYRKILQYLSGVFEGKTEPLTFVENGEYLRVRAVFVAGIHDFWIGRAGLTNISPDRQTVKTHREDRLFRSIALLFDGIYLLNLEQDEIEVSESVHAKVMPETVFHGIRESFLTYCREFVHLEDQERFLSFIDVEHLVRAARSSENGSVRDLFRVRREDGNYRWTLFLAVPLQDGGKQNIVVCESREVFEEYPDRKELLKVFASTLEPGLHMERGPEISARIARESGVMKAIFRFAGIPLFWTDRLGRFIGVNEEMLIYLGKRTRKEVIGRTAEELGVFVDPDDLRNMHERVLNYGATVHFSPLIAVSGESRRVPVTEFPWYSGNRIAGAAGWVHSGEEKQEQFFLRDAETGLLNDYGAMLTGSIYDTEYRRDGREYCVVYLALHDDAHLNRIFGGVFFRKIIAAAAKRVHSIGLPEGTSAAILRGCRFLLIGREDDSDRLLEAARKVQSDVRQIREIDGVECRLELDLAMASGAEAAGFASLVRILEERADRGGQQYEAMKEQNAARRNLMVSPALLDTSPERIVLIDPENNEILFINKALKRDLNLPENFSCRGRKCYSVLHGRSTACRFCPVSTLPVDVPAIRSRKFLANGFRYITREMLISWKGRAVRMCIGTPDERKIGAASAKELLDYEMWANESITTGMEEKDPSVGIEKTVERIAWNLQAERFFVFEEREDRTLCCTYEWCGQSQPPMKDELQSVLMRRMAPLYRMFGKNRLLMIPDYAAFCREHPDFWLPVEDVRNVISGQFVISGKSLGFTMVLNTREENFRQAGFVFRTLTDFLAVMIQNRNSLQAAVDRSLRDPLTGVMNRAGFGEYMRARTRHEMTAIISGDINGLKAVNDTQGHLAGDRLICSIAGILGDFADADHVFRMGGDEFLLIREGMDEAGARLLVQQIKNTCRAEGVSLSLGYTIDSGNTEDADEILRKADQSMYEDKGRFYHRRSTDLRV